MRNSRPTKATARFFRTVARCMTDLRFFREARGRRVSDAVGYLAVLLILTWVIPFSIEFFIGVRSANDAFVLGLRETVPADATFAIKDGAFTTDLQEPIVVRRDGFVFIVNTSTSTLVLGEDEVGIVVNGDAIVQSEGRDRMQVIGYADFPEFETDRSGIDDWFSAFGPWLVLLVSIVVIFAYAAATAVGYGLFVVLHALMFAGVLRIVKRPMRFARAFTVAAYAVTLSVIVRAVAGWTATDIGSVSTVLYWMLLGFIVYDYRKEVVDGHEIPKTAEDDRPPEDRDGRG